jgi:hypothetical protein
VPMGPMELDRFTIAQYPGGRRMFPSAEQPLVGLAKGDNQPGAERQLNGGDASDVAMVLAAGRARTQHNGGTRVRPEPAPVSFDDGVAVAEPAPGILSSFVADSQVKIRRAAWEWGYSSVSGSGEGSCSIVWRYSAKRCRARRTLPYAWRAS